MVRQIIIGMEIKLRPEVRGWSFHFFVTIYKCDIVTSLSHLCVNDHFDGDIDAGDRGKMLATDLIH